VSRRTRHMRTLKIMGTLKVINRFNSVAVGVGVWAWVHAHDDWHWYNHNYGNADGLALLAGLLVAIACWFISDKVFESSGY